MSGRAEALVDQALLVAVVDDDSVYCDYVTRLLEVAGVVVYPAASGAELLAVLARQEIDCIVLDYNLGSETGLGINQQVKGIFPDPPPVIMLTGEGKDQTILKAFRSGMSDFLSKQNLTSDGLLRAVRSAVDLKSAARTQRSEIERLKREVSRDHLTGLYTRDFMDARLAMVSSDAIETGGTYAVILVDLIGTGGINKSLGHVAGDEALAALAAQLLKVSRKKDVCGRYAGDEFLCLIDTSAGLQEVTSLCQQLSNALAFDIHYKTTDVKLRTTIGAALFPLHGSNPSDIVLAARAALDAARSSGAPFAIAASENPAVASGEASVLPAEQDESGAAARAPADTAETSFRQEERRSERRKRVLMRGQLVVHGLMSVIECTIRDISSGGARIKVDDYFAAPETFELIVTRSGERRRVELRWQNGDEIGVRFRD